MSGTVHGRPDVVVMLVVDDAEPTTEGTRVVDPSRSGVMVVLNASVLPVAQGVPGLAGQEWVLSEVQRHGSDDVVRGTTWDAARGEVTVPGLTAAVLVRPRRKG